MVSSNATQLSVIDWFRSASPYIKAHRNRTLVIALSSEWQDDDLLPTLTHDLTLLNHLGMRLVVCFGLRSQVEAHLSRSDENSHIVNNRRVTSAAALQAIINSAGTVRHKLEARLSMGLPNTPMSGSRLSVSSGNFVTAQPFGIHQGIDFKHTGAVREIHHEAINMLLDAGHLVLLPPLGYSLTGDVFNVTVTELASACAIALNADKLVYFVDSLPVNKDGVGVRQVSVEGVRALTDEEHRSGTPRYSAELRDILEHAVDACKRGVDRVHLLSRGDRDALLTEMFTRDGSGTLITNSHWEHIRPATIQDVGGIIELIEPLQAEGLLVTRSREQLELDIERFVVSERDGMVVSCAAMYAADNGDFVEIACLATHPAYRGEGRAAQLLEHLENRAFHDGYRGTRVLTTHTSHWFLERGYIESQVENLPEARRASYSWQRNSKIYEKPFASSPGSDHES